MKKIFFGLALSAFPIIGCADTYPYLTFRNADGTVRSVTTNKLEMKFVDGRLVAVSATDSLTIDLKTLDKMFFSSGSVTGVGNVLDKHGKIAVYNTQGVHVGDYASLELVYATLSRGVYVVKVNGKMQKIVVK